MFTLKGDIEKTGLKDILKLGLLHGANPDEATLEEEPEWLTYPHKLFQDFLAGFYSSKKSLKVNICLLNILYKVNAILLQNYMIL